MSEKKTYFCKRCKKSLSGQEFYTSHNLEKYPNDGKLDLCKECVTAHVNNWEPSTYLWILQEADVPYVPEVWAKIMKKVQQSGKPIINTSILGRYLSQMKLTQYKNYRWKDNEFLKQISDKKTRENMTAAGYSEAEIVETIEKNSIPLPQEPLPIPEEKDNLEIPPPPNGGELKEETASMPELDLTQEDLLYLRMKWGKNYRPEEWV